MNDFFAFAGGAQLATVLFLGLSALALYLARTFVKKL